MFLQANIKKDLVVYLAILIISYSLSNIGINNNYFVFIVPFIIFCFLNNKWYGCVSLLATFFCIGRYNPWYYLFTLIIVISFLLLRYILKFNNKKLKVVLSFYSFFVVLTMGVLMNVINTNNKYLLSFLIGVLSYWVMYYFYEVYIAMKSNEKVVFKPPVSVFILFILGISFWGLGLKIFMIDISFILVLLLLFIGSKGDVSKGVMYSFLMMVVMCVSKGFSSDLMIFMGTAIVVFLLSKVSKITFLFTYVVGVFAFIYYFKLDYLVGINYGISVFIYVLIPKKIIDEYSKVCFGSEQYIKELNKNYKESNLAFSSKVIKMEEIFSLVCNKINIKGRMKKCEKELLVSEINVFSDLMSEMANDIKSNYERNKYYKVEREIYKYGFDLLYMEVMEDVFKEKIIRVNVRCEKEEIERVIVKIISKELKQTLEVIRVKFNDVFGFYEVSLKVKKKREFKFGVSQRAKDNRVCGDSYLVYENESKKIFALSDGMGCGMEAKEKSKLALDLFKKFMEVGFDEEHTLNSINCILKNKYSKDSYATLDLLVYDKAIDEFYFCKNGASNSYIVHNESITTIEGNDLPIGIMDKIDCNIHKVSLEEGDYVVMVSDGVSERSLVFLNKLKRKDPQKISKDIISINKSNDDESVMIIMVKK